MLAEPPRSDSGYRLYAASDLVRLQRIRRLQALGLSLKQIKTLLGEQVSERERTLREVLQSLLEELSAEIQTLEEQRERIKTMLASDTLESSGTSPTLEFFKEHLGEPPAGTSEALLQLDQQIFSQVDAFNWPENYHEGLQTMVHYITGHPEKYQQMIALSERLVALASLPEDAPEVDQLIEDVLESEEMFALLAMQSELAPQLPQMAGPFADVLAEIASDSLSPAQKRFLEVINREQTKASFHEDS